MRQSFSKSLLLITCGLVLLGVGVSSFFRHEGKPIPRSALAHGAATGSVDVSTAAPSRPGLSRGVLGAPSPESVPARTPATVPAWHPRPPSEWQGMLVDMNATPPCEKRDSCGLALACKGQKCMPCDQDSECSDGEACVLDHCIRRENVACRRAADCKRGALCVLSGFSSTPRGNDDMRAQCVADASGVGSMPPGPTEAPAPDPRKTLPDDALIEAAKAAARGH